MSIGKEYCTLGSLLTLLYAAFVAILTSIFSTCKSSLGGGGKGGDIQEGRNPGSDTGSWRRCRYVRVKDVSGREMDIINIKGASLERPQPVTCRALPASSDGARRSSETPMSRTSPWPLQPPQCPLRFPLKIMMYVNPVALFLAPCCPALFPSAC